MQMGRKPSKLWVCGFQSLFLTIVLIHGQFVHGQFVYDQLVDGQTVDGQLVDGQLVDGECVDTASSQACDG